MNFPEVSLPENRNTSRFLHIHRNKPGVMSSLNQVFMQDGVNILGQYLQTVGDVGYVVIDVEKSPQINALLPQLKAIDGTIRARILY